MAENTDLPTLYWDDGSLYLLDQRYLPHRTDYRRCESYKEVADAIKEMSVRGAPAIGISAAYGMAVAAREALAKGFNSVQLLSYLEEASARLLQSRPTAVNLFWALQQMDTWLVKHRDENPEQIAEGLEFEAKRIHAEDVENNRRIGLYGADLIPDKASILTHCNAGALATGGYGTALGVIRAAAKQQKDIHVFVGETRPLLQGARITAYELLHDNISLTLITDNCAGSVIAQGKVDLVVVGADRIAANGDTVNKIGTYTLAVLASYHNIPFYVAAPLSTVDPAIADGFDVTIEERSQKEVTHINDTLIAPDGTVAFNPAFDVTPAGLVTALITEKGVVLRPDREKLLKLLQD